LYRKPIAKQLQLLSVISALALVVLTLFGALRARSDAHKAFVRETEHIVEAGVGMVKDFAALAQSGEMTLEEAQAAVLKAVRGMRYGEGDYLYVTDGNNRCIMHPVNQKLVGSDFNQLQDKVGVHFLRIMHDQAMAKGSASIVYQWPRPGSEAASPKLGVGTHVPEWNWVVYGGLYVDEVGKAFWRYLGFAALLLLIILVAQLAASRFISNGITRPLGDTTRCMGEVAEGRLNVDIPHQDLPNEVGQLARALEVFRANAQENERLKAGQEELRIRAERERRDAMLQLADRFEADVQEVVGAVAGAAEELLASAANMSATAEETSAQADTVAAAAEEAAANMQTVAAATEELGATSSEIGQQVGMASRVSETAVGEAQEAATQVEDLTRVATQIGDVAELITPHRLPDQPAGPQRHHRGGPGG